MARCVARGRPPLALQEAAARQEAARLGRRWHLLPLDDGRMDEVAILAVALRRYRAGAGMMPRTRGRPVDWNRLRAAVAWLRRMGVRTLSAAPRSRCVRSLMRFLHLWRERVERATGKRHGPATPDTAAELAGTLKALASGMGWHLSTP